MARPVKTEVTGTFTATGESAEVVSNKVDVSLSGTFSATVKIQRYMGGAWKDYDSKTAAYEAMIESAARYRWRLSCSAYTSGTVTYVLNGGVES